RPSPAGLPPPGARGTLARTMPDPPTTAAPPRALDRETLECLVEPATRARLRDALPICARPVDDVRAAYATTGLLGPTDAVYVLGPEGERVVAHVRSPDAPAVRTTLRVAIAALDAPETPLASAL